MAHGRLGIAEENSGKLVTLIRQQGRKLGEEKNLGVLLTDGPPGIGCPVIASIGGATAVLIVAEPSVSGRHDLERVGELAAFFKVPALVCINKFDLNPEVGRGIEAYARAKNIAVMGRIPFDPAFTRAMVQGQNIVEFDPHSQGCAAVERIWEKLAGQLAL
jgi:MinD superfamily P-loop ATPase